MTPTDTIIALEKALEAGPTAKAEWVAKGSEVWVGQRRICSRVTAGESMGMGPAIERERVNAAFIAAANPLAIRTLLDAHASALRDAEKLRIALQACIDRAAILDPFTLDQARAALDDNTKGAAE